MPCWVDLRRRKVEWTQEKVEMREAVFRGDETV